MSSVLLLYALVALGPQDPGLALITSAETPIESLNVFQLKQIYFGKLDRLVGFHLVALTLRKGHPLRALFEETYLGEPAELANYWLTQELLGESHEPLVVSDWSLVIAYVKRNPGYIGYIPLERAEEATFQGVRVIKITP